MSNPDLTVPRRVAERTLTDTCVITRRGSGEAALNEATGALTQPAEVTIYTGKCSVSRSGGELDADARGQAGETLFEETYELRLPVSATGIKPGDVADVSSSDPELADTPLFIVAVDRGSRRVLRRLAASVRDPGPAL